MLTHALALVLAVVSHPSTALTVAREMTAQPPRVGPGDTHSPAEVLYAYAFAGYAVVNDALDGAVSDEEALPLLDALLDAMAQPVMGRAFGCGWTHPAGHTVSRSVGHRGHLLLLLMGRARVAPLTPSQQQL